MGSFKQYGWIRTETDDAHWNRLKEHFKTNPYAYHEDTGVLIQFIRYGASPGVVICRDVLLDEERLLSGLLLRPLNEMEVIAHAAR